MGAYGIGNVYRCVAFVCTSHPHTNEKQSLTQTWQGAVQLTIEAGNCEAGPPLGSVNSHLGLARQATRSRCRSAAKPGFGRRARHAAHSSIERNNPGWSSAQGLSSRRQNDRTAQGEELPQSRTAARPLVLCCWRSPQQKLDGLLHW